MPTSAILTLIKWQASKRLRRFDLTIAEDQTMVITLIDSGNLVDQKISFDRIADANVDVLEIAVSQMIAQISQG